MYTIKIAHKFPCNAYAKQGNEKLFYCGDVIKRERETHTHTWLDNVVIFPARIKTEKCFSPFLCHTCVSFMAEIIPRVFSDRKKTK